MPHRTLAIAAAIVLASGHALAADQVTLTLTNGDTVTGELLSRSDESFTVGHPVLGTLTIPAASVESSVITPDPDAADESDTSEAEQPGETEAAEIEEAEPWEFELSAGLTGSAGSSQSENFRAGAVAERNTELNETTLSLSYKLERDEGENTDNRFEASARHDYLFPDSPWRAFGRFLFVSDQFETWDEQYRGTAGAGYEFIENDTTLLLGRFGGGAVYETGVDPEQLSPELFIGLEYEHQIDNRSSIALSTEIYPDLREDFEPRITNNAAYEITLSDEKDLALRIGAEHRYEPQTEDRSELDYFALLVYSF